MLTYHTNRTFFADANAIIDKSFNDVKKLLIYSKKNRGSVTKIANRLGNPEPCETEWLKLTPKDKMPQPDKVAFPKPPKAADGSLIYERIPNKGEPDISKITTGTTSPNALKRRHQGDDINGVGDSGKFLRHYKVQCRLIASLYIGWENFSYSSHCNRCSSCKTTK